MAGLGNLGGSLAMTLFGRVPEEEPAVSPEIMDLMLASLGGDPRGAVPAPMPLERPPPEDPRVAISPSRALDVAAPPVEIRRDPFWEQMQGPMRQAGAPGASRILDPGSEAGATGMQAPPAGVVERLGELGTWAGNALPFSGSTGAKPAAVRGLQEMYAPTATGRASLAQEIAAKLRQQTQRRYRERVVGEPMQAPVQGIQGLFDYGRAQGGELWYHDFWPTLQRIAGDEADKFAGVIAALSPQAFAGALTKTRTLKSGAVRGGELHRSSNLYLADGVWEAYKRGGEAEVLRVLGPQVGGVKKPYGVSQDKVDNVLRALRRQPLGAADPTEATKIRNFHKALMGDPQAVVLDTWMKKVFYPKSGVWNEKTLRYDYPPATAHGAFTPQQYQATERLIRDFATRNGVTPADVQAALWVAQKYLDQGDYAALASQPFKVSLRQIYQKLGRDLSVFDDPAGVAKHLAIVGVILGGGPAAMDILGVLEDDEAELVTSSGRQTLEQ